MNIAVSVAMTGGVGGTERSLYTLTQAMKGHSIDIYSMKCIPEGFIPSGENVTVRCFYKTTNGLAVDLNAKKQYDLYIYYATMLQRFRKNLTSLVT